MTELQGRNRKREEEERQKETDVRTAKHGNG